MVIIFTGCSKPVDNQVSTAENQHEEEILYSEEGVKDQ